MAKVEHIDVDSMEMDLRLQQPWQLHILTLEGIIVSEVASVSTWVVLTISQVQISLFLFFLILLAADTYSFLYSETNRSSFSSHLRRTALWTLQ